MRIEELFSVRGRIALVTAAIEDEGQREVIDSAPMKRMGNLGPFVTPSIVASINTATGAPVASMVLVTALWLAAGAMLTFVLRPAPATQFAIA